MLAGTAATGGGTVTGGGGCGAREQPAEATRATQTAERMGSFYGGGVTSRHSAGTMGSAKGRGSASLSGIGALFAPRHFAYLPRTAQHPGRKDARMTISRYALLAVALAAAPAAGCNRNDAPPSGQDTSAAQADAPEAPDETAPEAPPAPKAENPGSPPSANEVWVTGWWKWENARYVWFPGRWEVRRAGFEYQQARWVNVNGRWEHLPGRWIGGGRAVSPGASPPRGPLRAGEHDDGKHDEGKHDDGKHEEGNKDGKQYDGKPGAGEGAKREEGSNHAEPRRH